MPELPEVQTVLDTLALRIKDRAITDIRILYKPIVSCSEKRFKQSLIGQHFRTFKRRGKYLLFEMDDLTLVSHLRMEGKYFILDGDAPIGKHDHVIFDLDDGKQLRYNDVRKFGRMELIEKDGDYENFKDLGPEPFSDSFDREYCKEYLKNKKMPIKSVLLDQSFVAGIGNIYADEILFACGFLDGYLRKEEEAGRVFVIRPTEEVEVGRLEKNREKLTALYQMGYDDARDSMERLVSYLEN